MEPSDRIKASSSVVLQHLAYGGDVAVTPLYQLSCLSAYFLFLVMNTGTGVFSFICVILAWIVFDTWLAKLQMIIIDLAQRKWQFCHSIWKYI